MTDLTTAHPTVDQAVRTIAAVCDGARSRDTVGFDGQDTKFGRRLAAVPSDQWTDEMRHSAWQMLHKYRVQLASHGIDYDAIPEPPLNGSASAAHLAGRDDARALERRISEPRTLTVEGGLIVARFAYDDALIAAARSIPGRRWDAARKVNTFPLSSAAQVIAAFAGFDVAPEVAAHVVPEAVEAAVTERDRAAQGYVSRDGDRLVMVAPYDAAMVDAQRGVPGRKWDGANKVNTFPASSAAQVVEIADRFGLDVPAEVRTFAAELAEEQQGRRDASKATDADIEIDGRGGELMPFQRAGVAYALRTRRTFIADEMGLGKTVQALATVQALDAFPAVVVCPASLKLNWKREAEKWLPGKRIGVVSGRNGDDDVLRRFDVTIINYDVLAAWETALAQPQALILDESHYVKNYNTKRTKAAQALADSVPSDGVVLALTGTPVTNRAGELISQLKVLGRLREFGGVRGFQRRYMTFDGFGWTGSRNLDELHTRLRETCFVRRTKAEVLPELPAKRRAEVPVEMTVPEARAYAAAEADLLDFLANQAAFLAERTGDDPSAAASAAAAAAFRAEAIVRLTTLRRLAALGKVDAATEYVQQFRDAGEPVVVFVHHREVGERIAATLGAPTIQGGQSAEARQAAVDAFQAGESDVIVCSLTAAGVGLTLTAASNVVFVESGWTPAANDQAEDRCHRIGQTDAVTAWYLLADGTVDNRIAEIVAEKRLVTDAIHDGRAPEESAEATATAVLRSLGGAL